MYLELFGLKLVAGKSDQPMNIFNPLCRIVLPNNYIMLQLLVVIHAVNDTHALASGMFTNFTMRIQFTFTQWLYAGPFSIGQTRAAAVS